MFDKSAKAARSLLDLLWRKIAAGQPELMAHGVAELKMGHRSPQHSKFACRQFQQGIVDYYRQPHSHKETAGGRIPTDQFEVLNMVV